MKLRAIALVLSLLSPALVAQGRSKKLISLPKLPPTAPILTAGLPGSAMQAPAQGTESSTRELSSAIARVKSGKFAGIDVEMIARARAVDAISPLEEQFKRAQDANTKAKIASALVRLGDNDDQYWKYLVSEAAPAVQSDAPNFTIYDNRGKAVPGPSTKLLEWARAHGISEDDAMENALYRYPAAIGHLAMTGDPRAIPLLRKALFSPNYTIEILAAQGLAKANDSQSIPSIIVACEKAPPEVATVIAEHSLIYFEDADAQSAAERFIPSTVLSALHQEGHLPGSDPFR